MMRVVAVIHSIAAAAGGSPEREGEIAELAGRYSLSQIDLNYKLDDDDMADFSIPADVCGLFFPLLQNPKVTWQTCFDKKLMTCGGKRRRRLWAKPD
jgi:hypothetical protein